MDSFIFTRQVSENLSGKKIKKNYPIAWHSSSNAAIVSLSMLVYSKTVQLKEFCFR
jgi:hypothetical protein